MHLRGLLLTETTVKHNIKRLDRLFGNESLQDKTYIYYRVITKHIINANLRSKISIDWSGLTRCGAYHMLSAYI